MPGTPAAPPEPTRRPGRTGADRPAPRRFAAGETGQDEYGRRLSVLDERFGRGNGSGSTA
ncbi:hypothetical protein ACWD6K_27175 [Streptomyces sp. NPDC002431]